HQFRTGWTTITNVDLNGDGADELLYYNANTGFTRFINPNNTGTGTIIRDHQFRTGWTTITNVDLNGNRTDELLHYED
ncbi:hypothetical protein, partial [Ilumatobacter sp.]|uniref:hypothetical protein n=1 Tax=Ilumatobacter sp. TaxID=1967498 RepID=UPI003C51C844